MKSRKLKETMGNRIRGWLPKEPMLPGKYSGNQADNRKTDVLNKPLNELSFDKILTVLLGSLLIILGAVTVFNVNGALAFLQFISVFSSIVLFFGYALGFWIVVGAIVLVAVLVVSHVITKSMVKKNLTRRRLLPYIATAAIIFLTYIAYNSGIQFAYAIPITFIVSGIIVIKGLKRFAITLPAFIVLLISMLLLGTAFAGTSVVNYVGEDRYLTSGDAPNINTVNMTAYSLAGNIEVHFTDDPTQICHIAYLEGYGVITSGRSTGYYSQSSYVNETAPTFNYTIQDGIANITSWSYRLFVNITLNQDVKLNLNLISDFANIAIDAPAAAGNIQTIIADTQLGNINLNIANTSNLQNIYAEANNTLQAAITSTAHNQNTTMQLKGGQVKLNLDLTNVQGQISASATDRWGSLQANVQGFKTLSQDNTHFNAQTPNYNTATARIDIFAIAGQSTPPSMDITATYR